MSAWRVVLLSDGSIAESQCSYDPDGDPDKARHVVFAHHGMHPDYGFIAYGETRDVAYERAQEAFRWMRDGFRKLEQQKP